MDHSIYSPSRLKRIISCPGSVNLISLLESNKKIVTGKQSSYAAEGSSLHKAMEMYYNNGYKTRNSIVLSTLDTDSKALVVDAADYADTIFAGIGHKSVYFHTEQKVGLEAWGVPDVWGTLDYRILDVIRGKLHVVDWKFGAGVYVSAFRNPQLLAYAAGASGWPTNTKEITLHVVQPAIDNYDTYDITIDELYTWVHKDLAIAIGKCMTSTEEFNPSVEACRWCEAKNHCASHISLANQVAGELFVAADKLAKVPSIEDLIKLVDMASLVEDAIKGIITYITNELQLGHAISGFKLVEGRSNRKWLDENVATVWLSSSTKLDELFESKLKSPSKIEKEVKTLKTNKEFQALYFNPPGKVTLARDYDKREALQPTSNAVNVFAEYTDGE